MKTVYKYELPIVNESTIMMPKGAVVLRADFDPLGILCVWALVDTGAEVTPKTFYLCGTGHLINDQVGETIEEVMLQYVSTIMATPFVWHLFVVAAETDAS